MLNEEAQDSRHDGSNSNTRTTHDAEIDMEMHYYTNLRDNITLAIFEGQWLVERIQRNNPKSLLSSDLRNFLETCESIVSVMRKNSSKISFLEDTVDLHLHINNAHKFDPSSVAFENNITSAIKVLERMRGKIHEILENVL
jgi:hypothetical protein